MTQTAKGTIEGMTGELFRRSSRRTRDGEPGARRRASSSPHRLFEPAIKAALVVVVAGSALAAGGALPVFVLLLAPIALVAGAASLMLKKSLEWSRAPFYVLGGLALLSLFQSLPLPVSVLAKLSPSAADIWSRCLLPMGTHVSTGALSLDPQSSRFEALKWFAYAAVFAVSASTSARRGAAFAVTAVFATGTVIALVTVAHQVLEAEKLYGLYRPSLPDRAAPFINPNNLSGYLNLAAFCGIGLLFSRRKLVPRPLCASCIAIIIAVSIRTGSRGGIGALALGLLASATLLMIIRARRIDREARIWPVAAGFAGILAVGAILAILGGDKGTIATFWSDDASKLRVAIWARPLISDFKWTGIGRGAFESVAAAYRPPVAQHVVFTHPENIAVQWISEWGVLGGAALLLFAWFFRPTRLGATNSALHAGAAVGVYALVAQNLVDLSLELFGVGTAVSLLLGALWSSRRPDAARERGRAAAQLASAGLGFVALLAIIASGIHFVADDRLAVRDMLADKPLDAARLRRELREAMLRHPAEAFFPLAGALGAVESDENPMPWLQRALERGPYEGRTHLVLADVLSRRGVTNQSLLELRLAMQYEPGLYKTASEIALRGPHELASLLRAVPDGVDGIPMLERMAASLTRATDLPIREALDAETLSRDPTRRPPRERMVALRLDAMKNEGWPCQSREACQHELEQHAAAFHEYYPRSSRSDQLLAELEIRDHREDAAKTRLSTACSLPDDAPACYQLLASVSELEELPTIMEKYGSASCSTREACAVAYDWIAQTWEEKRQWGRALVAREKALSEAQTTPRFLAAATTAEKGGFYADAARILRRLSQFDRTARDSVAARLSDDTAKAADLTKR